MKATGTASAQPVAFGLFVMAALDLAACGDAGPFDSPEEDATSREAGSALPTEPADAGDNNLPAPPDVQVLYGDDFLDLQAWTLCYKSLCADGAPPQNPPDVGSPEQVTVVYPLEGWTFKASFEPAGQTSCARTFPTKLEEVEPGLHSVSAICVVVVSAGLDRKPQKTVERLADPA